MQAALLMNKLKQGAAVAESSKLMAAVAAAADATIAAAIGTTPLVASIMVCVHHAHWHICYLNIIENVP